MCATLCDSYIRSTRALLLVSPSLRPVVSPPLRPVSPCLRSVSPPSLSLSPISVSPPLRSVCVPVSPSPLISHSCSRLEWPAVTDIPVTSIPGAYPTLHSQSAEVCSACLPLRTPLSRCPCLLLCLYPVLRTYEYRCTEYCTVLCLYPVHTVVCTLSGPVRSTYRCTQYCTVLTLYPVPRPDHQPRPLQYTE